MSTAIIDLSALYWRNWHLSETEELSSAQRKTLGFVRSLYADYDNIYVAIDRPPYKRCDVFPDYKANRPPRNEAAVEELKKTIDAIKKDGWRVAYCDGYEADDVIATLVKKHPDAVVFGTDKDLLQCCDVTDPYKQNTVKTAQNTLCVEREKVVDYLALVGDSSDNIPGVKGVGPKTAVALIDEFDDIAGIYKATIETPEKFKKSTLENLNDAASWIDTTYSIIKLSYDLDLTIDYQEPSETVDAEYEETPTTTEETAIEPTNGKRVQHIVKHSDVSYERSLEPVGTGEAWNISKAFFESRLYSKFPTREAIFVTMIRGRALGLDVTTALDSIDVIQGKPTMSAQLMTALVQASPPCEYLYCEEATPEKGVWVTKRRNNPKEQRKEFTIEDAARLGLSDKDNWRKQPATMLQWRSGAAICRMVYPDVTKGLYAREEFE
jgi:5'-3' exonuclease